MKIYISLFPLKQLKEIECNQSKCHTKHCLGVICKKQKKNWSSEVHAPGAKKNRFCYAQSI